MPNLFRDDAAGFVVGRGGPGSSSRGVRGDGAADSDGLLCSYFHDGGTMEKACTKEQKANGCVPGCAHIDGTSQWCELPPQLRDKYAADLSDELVRHVQPTAPHARAPRVLEERRVQLDRVAPGRLPRGPPRRRA